MQRRFTKWLVSIAFLSTACGQTFSGGSPGGGSSTPDPGATPLPSMIQRDEAIALVTSGNADVGRVDRADAKLMTFADYLRVAGATSGPLQFPVKSGRTAESQPTGAAPHPAVLHRIRHTAGRSFWSNPFRAA